MMDGGGVFRPLASDQEGARWMHVYNTSHVVGATRECVREADGSWTIVTDSTIRDRELAEDSTCRMPHDTDARNPDLADQPPEVTTREPGEHGSLPPVHAAAERVNAFLAAFGDGMVNGETVYGVVEPVRNEPPLYARDLAALAELVARVDELTARVSTLTAQARREESRAEHAETRLEETERVLGAIAHGHGGRVRVSESVFERGPFDVETLRFPQEHYYAVSARRRL